MVTFDEFMYGASYVMAAGSIPLLYTAFKAKEAVTKVRFTIAAGFLVLMPLFAKCGNDRFEGIRQCEELLTESNAETYTTNNYERHNSIERFCYDDSIREEFLELVDKGLESKLTYEQVCENYPSE